MADHRQIVLDTETTGLEASRGHRIIEIGAVELVNRRFSGKTFHQYINPEREIDAGALEVHGIGRDFLADKPVFTDIATEFLNFVAGAELVIHNAPFDIGFLNYELELMGDQVSMSERCTILDSLALARQIHPGQRNSLDALCKRYAVDNSARELHGALLDAEILADVYLIMTGGQVSLGLGSDTMGSEANQDGEIAYTQISREQVAYKVMRATESEVASHDAYMDRLAEETEHVVWRQGQS